ncbi:hypothetical protein QA601_18240 [Chitinispirillales bacterium ANBcel5]|uniref:hypothetical protein n=1 Tax=Cellulosispirillum alkaliphilum TaxID=3039283 RepID=UPI002A56D850|nr:hypothetical protein [Chitinispirillales bacterium ANBcel5]
MDWRIFKGLIIGILIVAFSSYGIDDFSDPGESNIKWVNSNDFISTSFSGGQCKITNTEPSGEIFGYIRHSISGTKPSTFTISTEVVSSSSSNLGGIVFCLQPGQGFEGYALYIDNGNIVVLKFLENSGSEIVFNALSSYLKPENNEIVISKDGSLFNIFINGEFEGTFTDSQYSTGDIGLFSPGNSEVVYQYVTMENTFRPHEPISYFYDNFESGKLPGWVKHGEADVRVDDGQLKVNTLDDTNATLYYRNITVENFVAAVEVSHRGGANNSSYGLLLLGEEKDILFPIVGGRLYSAGFLGELLDYSSSQVIRGAPYDDGGSYYYYTDTLMIQKEEGSQEYKFMVNGQHLTSFTTTDFDVTGVGLFIGHDLELYFDNFGVAEGNELNPPVSITRRRISGRGGVIRGNQPSATFDLRGRRIGEKGVNQIIPELSPSGVYINNHEGRKIRLR